VLWSAQDTDNPETFRVQGDNTEGHVLEDHTFVFPATWRRTSKSKGKTNDQYSIGRGCEDMLLPNNSQSESVEDTVTPRDLSRKTDQDNTWEQESLVKPFLECKSYKLGMSVTNNISGSEIEQYFHYNLKKGKVVQQANEEAARSQFK